MNFDLWYRSNIESTIPNDAPPQIKAAARQSMAACWNAALDAAHYDLPAKNDPRYRDAREKLRAA